MDASAESERFERAGIRGLLRAADRGHWSFGHFGAALLSGSWLLGCRSFPEPARRALHARLDRLVTAHPEWFAVPEPASGRAVGVAPLVEALAARIAVTRNSGHGTIFTTAALRSLSARPEWATAPVLDAVLRLHELAQDADPERYLGHANYFEAQPMPDNGLDDCATVSAAVRQSFRECRQLAPDQAVKGRHYFVFGEKIHLLTHAHALLWLARLGHPAVAKAGLRAQRKQLWLTRFPESARLPLPAPTSLGPADAGFWNVDGHDIWHKLKLSEAVVALLPLLEPGERRAATQTLGSMWALLGVTDGRARGEAADAA